MDRVWMLRFFFGGILSLLLSTGAWGARLVSVATCRAVSEPGTVASGATDRFSADVTEIHAVVVLSGAQAGSTLKGVWICVDAIDVPNYEIRTSEVKLSRGGDQRIHLSLSNKSFPRGNYKLSLYLDGQPLSTVPFSVGAPAAGPGAAPPSKSIAPAAAPTPPSPAASPQSRLGAALTKPSAGLSFALLKGTWRAQGPYGPITMVFQSPEKLILADEPLGYSVVPGALRVVEDGEAVNYGCSLRGESLLLSMPEGGQLEFRKVSDSTSHSTGRDLQAGQGAGNGSPGHPNQGYQGRGYPGYGAGAQDHGASGNEWQLQGRFCTYGGSSGGGSSYSRTGWAEFDGHGNFRYGSESSFSSGAGMAYGGSPGGSGQYRVQGNTVLLIYPDGSQEQAAVHVRQNDGRITEVRYGSDLYSPALCE
jgi:hypothetical protein